MRDPSWTPLADGIYIDDAGELHLVLRELLAANGYANTPENRETLIGVLRQRWPAIDLRVVADDGEDS